MNKEQIKTYESDFSHMNKILLEYKKLKMMTWKKRGEYLWSYYKFVPVILFFAVIVIYSIGTVFTNMPKNALLSVVVVDANRENLENAEILKEELLRYLDGDLQKEQVNVDMSATSGDAQAQTIKTAIALSTVESNDIVLGNADIYNRFRDQNAFADWKDVLGGNYQKYEKYIIDGAFDFSQSKKWQDLGLTAYSPVYACVLQNSENMQNIRMLLEYFFCGE